MKAKAFSTKFSSVYGAQDTWTTSYERMPNTSLLRSVTNPRTKSQAFGTESAPSSAKTTSNTSKSKKEPASPSGTSGAVSTS